MSRMGTGKAASKDAPILAPPVSRLSKFVVCTLTIASFGPYVIGSVRTEQIAVYGLTVVLLPFLFPHLRVAGGMRFLAPWLMYILTATIAALFPTDANVPWGHGSLAAGLDNILGPLAVMLLIWSVVTPPEAESLLKTMCRIVAVAMSINGALAIISTRIDLSAILRPFWSTDTGGTVAALAAQLGRYSGIFNQPAEAGIAYSIAGLAAIYVWHEHQWRLMLVLALIAFGGLISVSKVFILGGLPLMLIYWFVSIRGGRKLAVLVGTMLVALGIVQSGALNQWIGFDYLTRLLAPPGDTGVLAFYTAGRVQNGSVISPVSAAALNASPVVGIGPAGWAVPYDSAFTEALVVAGIIGVILYGFVLLGMLTLAHATHDRRRRVFTYLLLIAVVAAALGFSPLTANRVSTLIWMLIALLVVANRHDPSTAINGTRVVAAVPATRVDGSGKTDATVVESVVPSSSTSKPANAAELPRTAPVALSPENTRR